MEMLLFQDRMKAAEKNEDVAKIINSLPSPTYKFMIGMNDMRPNMTGLAISLSFNHCT